MADFSRLSRTWSAWAERMGYASVSVLIDASDADVYFRSGDESYLLRRDADWWVIDTTDDRGRRYADTAKLSTFELSEKYLVWRWGSTMRQVFGAPIDGPELYAKGYSPAIEVRSTENEWKYELRAVAGIAILPEPYSVIFSHLMSKSVDEIERRLTDGLLL